MVRATTDQLLGWARGFAGRVGDGAQKNWAKLGVLAKGSPASPFDPVLESGPQLPGTSDRAFWSGLIVVSLSVISGLATYLILTGLTPIVPRNDVVLTALVINALLAVAMVAI